MILERNRKGFVGWKWDSAVDSPIRSVPIITNVRERWLSGQTRMRIFV